MSVIDAPRSPIVPENPDSNDTSEPMEIIQKISYKESDEGLFGHGKNPEYLHPSDMTYNADFVIEIKGKKILLHRNILVQRVPYFATFGKDSDFVERNTTEELVDNVSKQRITVNKINLDESMFDPDVVAEYFSFVYNKEIPFKQLPNHVDYMKYLIERFEIADYFSDELISAMFLKRMGTKLDLNILPFAWKHPKMSETCKKFIEEGFKEEPHYFYRLAHRVILPYGLADLRKNWKGLELFEKQLLNMGIENLVTFLAELMDKNRIDDYLFAFLITKWIQHWQKNDDVAMALKMSELLRNHVRKFNKSDDVSFMDMMQDLYSFLVSTPMSDAEKSQIHEKLFYRPISTGDARRENIQKHILDRAELQRRIRKRKHEDMRKFEKSQESNKMLKEMVEEQKTKIQDLERLHYRNERRNLQDVFFRGGRPRGPNPNPNLDIERVRENRERYIQERLREREEDND